MDHIFWCYGCAAERYTRAITKNPSLGTDIFRCPGCSLLQTVPPSSSELQRINLNYRRKWSDEEIKSYRVRSVPRAKSQLAYIASVCPDLPKRPDLAGLDFGAGIGVMCQEMLGSGFKTAVGLESDTKSIEIMRGLEGIQIVEALDLVPPNSLDLITLSHVLEHIEDPVTTLRLLIDKLKSQGILYLEVPNEGSMVLDGHLHASRGAINFGHLFHYDARSLASLLSRLSGISLAAVTHYGFTLEEWFRTTKCDVAAVLPNQRVWIRAVVRRT